MSFAPTPGELGRAARLLTVRSRREASQRATLKGLGLNKIGRVKDLQDNPSTRGMIDKVAHLVRVVEGK